MSTITDYLVYGLAGMLVFALIVLAVIIVELRRQAKKLRQLERTIRMSHEQGYREQITLPMRITEENPDHEIVTVQPHNRPNVQQTNQNRTMNASYSAQLSENTSTPASGDTLADGHDDYLEMHGLSSNRNSATDSDYEKPFTRNTAGTSNMALEPEDELDSHNPGLDSHTYLNFVNEVPPRPERSAPLRNQTRAHTSWEENIDSGVSVEDNDEADSLEYICPSADC